MTMQVTWKKYGEKAPFGGARRERGTTVARRDAERRGVVGMDQERGNARALLLQRHIGEDRIQEVMIRGREQRKWVFSGSWRRGGCWGRFFIGPGVTGPEVRAKR